MVSVIRKRPNFKILPSKENNSTVLSTHVTSMPLLFVAPKKLGKRHRNAVERCGRGAGS